MTKLKHLSELLYASYVCISTLQKHASTLKQKELCRYLMSSDGLPEGYVNVITLESLLRNKRRTKKTIHGQS
jgi:hypothetical protein